MRKLLILVIVILLSLLAAVTVLAEDFSTGPLYGRTWNRGDGGANSYTQAFSATPYYLLSTEMRAWTQQGENRNKFNQSKYCYNCNLTQTATIMNYWGAWYTTKHQAKAYSYSFTEVRFTSKSGLASSNHCWNGGPTNCY